MRSGLHVGRVFGITINIDWSWLVIFMLVTWNLAVVFGQMHPTWTSGLQWGLALIAALLFFGSVVAHELAHSLVARAQGVPVRNITLFMFGGVSSIEKDPKSPFTEFTMAVVGPLTSLIIGVVLVVLAGATSVPFGQALTDPFSALARMSPLATLLLWLGSINFILGIFNLTPGFPLDGGRVVRSILWGVTGNVRIATRLATWLGQIIAWLLIFAGISMAFGVVLPFFGTGLIGGIWLAFIGWFLNDAASQSYRQLVVHDILEGVSVTELMRPNPPVAAPDLSVASLVHDNVMGTDERSFPVVQDDSLAGIVTLEDVRKVPRERWESTLVRDIMTPVADLVTVAPGEDAADALDKLSQRDVNQLPVVSGGRLVGLLRRRDIVKWLQLQADVAHTR